MSCGGVPSGAQPWSTASHQLAKALTQALPPGGAVHFPAGTMAHRMRPLPRVWQQTAFPGRPQIDRAAQRIASCTPSRDRCPAARAFTAWRMQRR
jgi:hypothetical protein